ncbi:MAG TPA: PAS domain S-box protein [Candidatus Acidoferrum sp.]|nr:PAS domain S-box protein [Candidatus Acidoferrum sp.]
MAKLINVLVVEDSDNDTLLLLQELRRSGYEPNHCRVDTAGGMQLALQQHTWDVVLSDYSMPQFSGEEALRLFAGMKLDTPFIFVSGTLGEEAAVRMMKAGANDYFIKGNTSCLVPAIEREMEAARMRRDRSRAEAAMYLLAAIVESSEDAIYSVNLESSIISWNRAAETIYGYRAEEIVGRSIAALIPLGRREDLLETLAQLRRGQLVGTYQTECQRKNRRLVPISMTISPIKNNCGKIIGASVIARDISRQKQNEEDHVKLIAELSGALNQVKTLTEPLAICAHCNRILDGQNHWLPLDKYIAGNSNALFTRGICPECAREFELEAGQKS